MIGMDWDVEKNPTKSKLVKNTWMHMCFAYFQTCQFCLRGSDLASRMGDADHVAASDLLLGKSPDLPIVCRCHIVDKAIVTPFLLM